MKTKPFKHPYYLLALTMCSGLSANAQKLPNVQPAGIYAPNNVKIDGKATEWGNQLQAFNKTTAIFYTMANNNNNLYLVVRATDFVAMDKILGAGLSLTITGKNGALAFTTPITDATNRSNISKAVRNSEAMTDSLATKLNKELNTHLKEVTLKGIAAIPDPTISVFNEYGIKVSGYLGTDKAYTCEVAIPLKYITPILGEATDFKYNIMVNGVTMNVMTATRNGEVIAAQSAEMAAMMANVTINGASMMELSSPTDFSGTYTLAKK
ncbi:hypothetical protein GCM10027049_29460 [Mucilaginibacter puniceus]